MQIGDPAAFGILCVCTGNICRSPAAERLLAARLGPSVDVRSAGTHALVGNPVQAEMVAQLEAAGVSSTGFAARLLTPAVLKPADLVLAMTRAHRSAAVEVWPGAVRRAFTLLEFARLVAEIDPAELPDGTPAERLRAAVPLAAARRRWVAGAPDLDDIADPYRRSAKVYADSFRAIADAVEIIAARMAPG